jgi:hypothetical protein
MFFFSKKPSTPKAQALSPPNHRNQSHRKRRILNRQLNNGYHQGVAVLVFFVNNVGGIADTVAVAVGASVVAPEVANAPLSQKWMGSDALYSSHTQALNWTLLWSNVF